MNSGFPVVAALILMGLILAIAIWDTIKARIGQREPEDLDEEFKDAYNELFDDEDKKEDL